MPDRRPYYSHKRKKAKKRPPTMPMGLPEVTIFADASMSGDEKSAGWGAWVKSNSMERAEICGGPFKHTFGDIRTMELAALANAMVMAEKLGVLKATVLLQSDCVVALWTLITHAGAIDTPFLHDSRSVAVSGRWGSCIGAEPVLAVIRDVMERTGVKVYVRHVKGHQKGGGRNWVNNLVDAVAKGGMVQAKRKQKAPALEADPNIL